MDFKKINKFVEEVPFISVENAYYLYNLIIREKLTRILELGIAHGTATCYMAAALDEIGEGEITSVDLMSAKEWCKPLAEEQVRKVGLEHFVHIERMKTGYTWFLHDEITKHTAHDICNPEYDLCIIDGPKNWTIDGCAFFLVDKLLKKDGLIIFDDYNWTYGSSKREQTDGITHRQLSVSERNTPHVKEIFELLVKQHPNYSDFYVNSNTGWAIARKSTSDSKSYIIEYQNKHPNLIKSIVTKVFGSLVASNRKSHLLND